MRAVITQRGVIDPMVSSERSVWQAWINGRWTDSISGQKFSVDEPATGLRLAEVSKLSSEDVDQVVGIAKRQFDSQQWSGISATARGKVLYRLATLIHDNADVLAQWETRQGGKTFQDSLDEVHTAADCFEYYAGAANKIFGHTIPVSAKGLDYTLRVPVGVVALIVPWNFPFLITAWKVAPALAAGNSVIVKPASYTPLTALALGELTAEAGIPDGIFNVTPGPGSEVGEALVSDPRVDKIAFTGETTTGTRILQLAAPGIKRVSLELGGKSPTIAFSGIDIERFAKLAVQSAYGNAGQDCCARSRVLVERKILEPFTEAFVRNVKSLSVGNPFDPHTAVGPLVSQAHRNRVSHYIDLGLEEGGTLAMEPEDRTVPDQGYYLAPVVFTNVNSQMAIVREEIFGPVSSIQAFDTEEEAIRLANDTPYGLAGSIFSNSVGQALRVAAAVRTGVMSVNSIKSVHLEAPFGGFKQSGLGRELGMEAFDHYTETKNIFVSLDD